VVRINTSYAVSILMSRHQKLYPFASASTGALASN